MDLTKFVAMLASNTLWFAKMAEFHDDPFEGFCTVTRLKMPQNDPLAKCITRTTPEGDTHLISLTQLMVELSEISADELEDARRHLYVNSWCLSEESMAMWQVYGASGYGIAVKSSVGKYINAAKLPVPTTQFAFDRVDYSSDLNNVPALLVDFNKEALPVGAGLRKLALRLAFYKRRCFKHEEEWRGALYQDLKPECRGINIYFKLDELITEVVVGPRAEGHFLEVVESVMEKYGLNKPLAQSDLLQFPAGIQRICKTATGDV
jgi:hypothetical protein